MSVMVYAASDRAGVVDRERFFDLPTGPAGIKGGWETDWLTVRPRQPGGKGVAAAWPGSSARVAKRKNPDES